jgi:hypothetical protein
MQPAGFRVRESLDAGSELTIILDASDSPSSRLRALFLAHNENSIQIQLGTALGQNLLVSVAGEVQAGLQPRPAAGVNFVSRFWGVVQPSPLSVPLVPIRSVVAEFVPFLRAARWTGVGRQTYGVRVKSSCS